MAKAFLMSGVAHVTLALGLIAGPLWFADAPPAAPLTIDVSIVDISELETVVPPLAAPVNHEPKARAIIPEKPKVEPVKRVEKPKETESKVAERVIEKRDPPSNPVASESPMTAPAAAQQGGGVDAVQKARVSYRDMVASKLARAKRYPERAVRGRITGRGVVRLTIDSSGAVVTADVAESTQSEVLDDELIRMVDRAGPFDPFPGSMTQEQLTLVVPVAFRLEN